MQLIETERMVANFYVMRPGWSRVRCRKKNSPSENANGLGHCALRRRIFVLFRCG